MNLRTYLRFLRPLRSLAVVALYTFIAAYWGQYLIHLDHNATWFNALAVALPLLLGFFIAGAVHEPMHRPFALVLPDIRQRQRTSAVISVLICAFAATCGASWTMPTVSSAATFGLACALSALPCIDRHQRLFGMAGGLAAFLIWLLLGMAAATKLTLALNAAPWLFLFGGLSICTACMVWGFSRESLRARADTLFIAYQTNAFSYLFHPGMLVRWQAEVAVQRNRRKQGRPTAGRDWAVRSVGSSTREWMRVLWHANFGCLWRGSFLGVQLRFAAVMLVSAAAMLGAAHFFGLRTSWAFLARFAAPDLKTFTTTTATAVGSNFMLLHTAVATLCALSLLRPQLAYPISRLRLARVVYRQAVVQWGAALVVPAMTIFFASLLGQIMSGQFLPGLGLPALLAADLPLAVLLPLLVAVGTVRRTTFRILAAVPIGLALITAGVTRHLWSDHILTLPGILGGLAATAASQGLLWHGLRREYATQDLTPGPSPVHPFAPGTPIPH